MDISRLPMNRRLDPRWNSCLDALTAAWNTAGPDVTLGMLRALAELESDSEESGEVA